MAGAPPPKLGTCGYEIVGFEKDAVHESAFGADIAEV